MGQHATYQRHAWEATYSVDFTLEEVRRRCRTLADVLVARRWNCLVAYDTRFLGAHFARDCARQLQAAGVATTLAAAAVPYPALELVLEQKRADCVLLISAGNLPYWQNGMIVLAPAGVNGVIEPAADAPVLVDTSFPSADRVEMATIDLRPPYLEYLRSAIDIELIRRSPLTVFVDLMAGSASGMVPLVFGEGSQAKAIEINREPDALFGRQVPHPADSALQRLRKLVKESNSHFGAALSADGRAINVVDNQGDLVRHYELALLLGQYMVRQYRQRGLIVIPALPLELADAVRQWEARVGMSVEQVADPAVRIAEITARDRSSLLAGITAGGELTLGRCSASPDATLAVLALAEAAARGGARLHDLIHKAMGA